MRIEKKRLIHFREADPAGILFFGRLPEIYHDIFEEGLTENLAWREVFGHSRWGLPIRHLNVDYLKPLKAGTFYTFRIHIANLTEHSIEVQLQVTEGESLHAQLKCVHVCVDQDLNKKTKLPEIWREALEALR